MHNFVSRSLCPHDRARRSGGRAGGSLSGPWQRGRTGQSITGALLWVEVGGEAETIPAETIPADKDVLALVIRVTEAPALNCWSCSMYEWMKLQGSRVHPHVL